MKIGFFGTPDIAAHCLEELAKEHEIIFAVTPCDKPTGRHQHMQCCPAKDAAVCHDIPVLQPDNLKDEEFVKEVQSYDADIFVVVAYGKLIPKEIFNFPPENNQPASFTAAEIPRRRTHSMGIDEQGRKNRCHCTAYQ